MSKIIIKKQPYDFKHKYLFDVVARKVYVMRQGQPRISLVPKLYEQLCMQ